MRTLYTLFIGLFLSLMLLAGWILRRKTHSPNSELNPPSQDAGLLWFLLCVAIVCVLGYLAFAFRIR